MVTRGLRWVGVVLAVGVAACTCGPGECSSGQTRPCPLTQGVCAGAVSRCTGGQWAACDYGADYQLTERRCDGLDNDCDGRVDRSWARVIRANPTDGGWQNTANDDYHLLPQGNGWLVVTPGEVGTLDVDLIEQTRLIFPARLGYADWVFPTSDGWMRIADELTWLEDGGVSWSVFAHAFAPDGGFTRNADGGLGDVRRRWLAPDSHGPFFAALAVPDGWSTLTRLQEYAGEPKLLSFTWFGADGGMIERTLDAGPGPGSNVFARARAERGAFDVSAFDNTDSASDSGSELWRVSADGLRLDLSARFEHASCASTSSPRGGWTCWRTVNQRYLSTVYESDGGVLVPEFEGAVLYTAIPTDTLYARTWDDLHATTLVNDAGATERSEPSDLVMWADGGLRVVAHFEAIRETTNLRVQDVGPGLALITRIPVQPFADWRQGFDLMGEYACVP